MQEWEIVVGNVTSESTNHKALKDFEYLQFTSFYPHFISSIADGYLLGNLLYSRLQGIGKKVVRI